MREGKDIHLSRLPLNPYTLKDYLKALGPSSRTT